MFSEIFFTCVLKLLQIAMTSSGMFRGLKTMPLKSRKYSAAIWKTAFYQFNESQLRND
jgi:hypothetical protein